MFTQLFPERQKKKNIFVIYHQGYETHWEHFIFFLSSVSLLLVLYLFMKRVKNVTLFLKHQFDSLINKNIIDKILGLILKYESLSKHIAIVYETVSLTVNIV